MIAFLQWHLNERNGISNHQHPDCLLNRLFWRRLKKTLKLRVTGLCEGNSPVTGEFPTQRASNVENVSMWWHHHVLRVWGQESTRTNDHPLQSIPLGRNFAIQTLFSRNIFKMLSTKWQPFCSGLNLLKFMFYEIPILVLNYSSAAVIACFSSMQIFPSQYWDHPLQGEHDKTFME